MALPKLNDFIGKTSTTEKAVDLEEVSKGMSRPQTGENLDDQTYAAEFSKEEEKKHELDDQTYAASDDDDEDDDDDNQEDVENGTEQDVCLDCGAIFPLGSEHKCKKEAPKEAPKPIIKKTKTEKVTTIPAPKPIIKKATTEKDASMKVKLRVNGSIFSIGEGIHVSVEREGTDILIDLQTM